MRGLGSTLFAAVTALAILIWWLSTHSPSRTGAPPVTVSPAGITSSGGITPTTSTRSKTATGGPTPAEHGGPAAADPLTVYRWQDAAGEWHVSNLPPPDPGAAETYDYAPR